MTDPRMTDAIRRLPDQLEAMNKDIRSLKESLDYIKDMLRQVKKSTVRKYGKEDDGSSS